MSFLKKCGIMVVIMLIAIVINFSLAKTTYAGGDSGYIGYVNIKYYVDLGMGQESGKLTLDHNRKPGRVGYDFLNEEYVYSLNGDSPFYLGMKENKKFALYGNESGTGGIYKLPNARAKMPDVNEGVYRRDGVEIKNGGLYAIYDDVNDLYIKILVAKTVITGKTKTPSPLFPIIPALTAPQNNITLLAGADLFVAWTAVPQTKLYKVEVNCETCAEGWRKLYTINNNDTSFYIPFADLANGDQRYKITINSVNQENYERGWSESRYFYANKLSASQSVNQGAASQQPVSTIVNPPTASQPVVTSPAANDTIYEKNVVVTWSEIPGAVLYQVNLECETCNASSGLTSGWYLYEPQQIDKFGNRSATFKLPTFGGYRVHVQAVTAPWNVGPWSEYVNFSYNNQANSLVITPEIIVPSNNFVFNNSPRYPNLSWYKITAASSYDIQIDCSGCSPASAWSLVGDFSVANSVNNRVDFSTYPTAMPGDYSYRARVRAKDSRGNVSAWSNYSYFSFASEKQNTSPPIAISATLNTASNYATLKWNPISNVTLYQIQVDCDSCLTSGVWSTMTDQMATPIVKVSETANSFDVYSLIPGITYRARVRANGANNWSDYTTFISPKATDITKEMVAPKITAPGIDVAQFTKTPTLQWTSVGGAVKYSIYIDFDELGNGNWVEFRNYNTVEAYTSDIPTLFRPGNYRFRVKAIFQDDSAGPVSDFRNFRYQPIIG